MIYPFFAIYIIVGIGLSLPVIYWAVKNGQFRDQQRARFLPLEERSQRIGHHQAKISRYEAYALGTLAAAGLLATAAVLVAALAGGA